MYFQEWEMVQLLCQNICRCHLRFSHRTVADVLYCEPDNPLCPVVISGAFSILSSKRLWWENYSEYISPIIFNSKLLSFNNKNAGFNIVWSLGFPACTNWGYPIYLTRHTPCRKIPIVYDDFRDIFNWWYSVGFEGSPQISIHWRNVESG